MNIEYVYIILVGINRFMKIREIKDIRGDDFQSALSASLIEISKTVDQTQVKFNGIDFKDINKWDVLKEVPESIMVISEDSSLNFKPSR